MPLIAAGGVLAVVGLVIAVYGVWRNERRRPEIPNVERLGVSGSVRRAP